MTMTERVAYDLYRADIDSTANAVGKEKFLGIYRTYKVPKDKRRDLKRYILLREKRRLTYDYIYPNDAETLVGMELQPPNEWNMDGVIFGNTRTNLDGSPKEHRGIDFAALVGTDIFSVYDGVVTKIVDEQVNRVKNSDGKYVYPDNYTGTDRDGAGNRIYIKSTINGEDIYGILAFRRR